MNLDRYYADPLGLFRNLCDAENRPHTSILSSSTAIPVLGEVEAELTTSNRYQDDTQEGTYEPKY